jgi:peptidoglycan/LPS O-acetylase OafA/YrhL
MKLNDDILKSNNKDKNIERIYFPELDGLRFFAFLLVFVHHHSLFSALEIKGWIGVDLFFVLSAFLFTKLLIAEYFKTQKISFIKFYLRRIFRIWPIYFLFIGFSVTLYFYLEGTLSRYIEMRIIGLLAFSDNILTAFSGWNPLPYSVHLWTIAYEEQFYIFVPIIIYFLVRSSLKTKLSFLISIYILFNIIRLFLIANNANSTEIIVMLPFTRFESIFLGMVIGFNGFDFLLKKVSSSVLGLIGILFFVLLYMPPLINVSYWIIVEYTFVGISTSLILFSVLNNNFLRNLFSNKILVFLGKRSYGLYVYHLLGIGFADYMIEKITVLPSSSLASFIYSFLFTVIVSIISYKIIETPFLKLKKKFEVIISRPI